MPLRTKRARSLFENVVCDINGVSHVDQSITVGVTGFNRIRCRTIMENIVCEVNRVGDINTFITICIAANYHFQGYRNDPRWRDGIVTGNDNPAGILAKLQRGGVEACRQGI